ncbi:MAG: hypothetical protein ABI954_05540 [Pyrinomonadaceae bacterium]
MNFSIASKILYLLLNLVGLCAVSFPTYAQNISPLEQLRAEGGKNEQRQIFYTALYRSHYMPHDG